MRSRYQHDGSVDLHAESEHEILRRAEERLERQRLASQATPAAMPIPQLGTSPVKQAPTSSTRPTSPTPLAAPTYPHDEIAARFALKPNTQATTTPGLSWPPAPSTTASAARTNSRRR